MRHMILSTPATRIRTTALVAAFTCILGWLGETPLAQGLQTGSIQGRIVDEHRVPIATAIVTLKSPALQGVRATPTRHDGSYSFEQLTTGAYEISVEAPHFRSVTQTAIVQHTTTVQVEIVLRDEASARQRGDGVAVSAEITAPGVTTSFTYEEIDRLAVPRTLTGIAQLSPGTVSRGDGNLLVINGATARDNVFAVDGVDVTDNVTGAPQSLLVEEAVSETAVVTSGAPAEYGRLAGGLVSTVTQSGGNRFSGSYRANLSSRDWTARTPFDECEPAITLGTCRKADAQTGTSDTWHEATIGGYLLRDRMWFFGAGDLAHSSATTQLPLSGDRNAETGSNRRGEVKMTSALAQGQTLTFVAATNLMTNTNHRSLPSTADPFAVGKQAVPNYFYLMNYRGQAGKKAFVDAQFATRRLAIRELGAASTARVDSPMFTRSILSDGSPALYNAPYFDAGDNERRNSMQAGANVTYFLATPRAGSHRIKGGYEFFRAQHVGGNSQSSTGYVFETDYVADTNGTSPRLDASNRFIPLWVPGQTLLETWLPARGAILNVDTQSAYVQDHWVIAPRWAVDAGLRYERVRTGAAGAFTHVDARTPLPRLAVGYNVDDRGGRVIHATYGRYEARLDEILLGRNSSVGNPDVWQGVYVGPAGQGRSYTAGLDPANYLTLAGRFPTANVVVDPGLSPPIARELTVSYGMDLDSRGFLEAAYVSRHWDHLIDDDVSIANGTTHVVRKGFDVGTFTNVIYKNSDADQRYDALEFQGRVIAGSFGTAAASYTLQLRNDGHGSAAAEAPGATSALGDYPEIFTGDRHDPVGHLVTFQRHRLRLWGTHDARLGQAGTVTLSAILRVESGAPYSLEAANQRLTPIQSARLLTAGYPDQPPSQTIFFGNLGSQQFKGYGVVDLAVVYRAPFVARLRPWAKLELYNALNNTKQIAWDTTIVPDQSGPVDALGLPTAYHAAPSFGKATSNRDFPAPFAGMAGGRTVRLALGLRF